MHNKSINQSINLLYNPKTEFIICGDLNINFSGSNNKKTQLENLLSSYNLKGTLHFPMRIIKTSSSTIDSIFVDKISRYTIEPYINGLSDHDAQILKLNDVTPQTGINRSIPIRKINKQTEAEFLSLLRWELWEDVFGNNNVNTMFNNFLNTYLRCSYSSFSKINVSKSNQSFNTWITK